MKQKQLNPHGLSEKEQAVLDCITQPTSLAQAAVQTELPRSTAEYILKKLVGLKLIQQIPHGKRFLYQSFPNIIPCGPFTLYKGCSAIQVLWDEINSHPKESRLLAIQPKQSIRQAIHKNGKLATVAISQKLTDQRFIIDAILHEGIFDDVASEISDIHEAKKVAKVFTGRPEDIVKVDRDFLNEKSEMYIIGEMLIFVDWFKEVGIKIIDKNIQNFMKSMYHAVKVYGTKYHQGAELEKTIDRN